MFNYINYLKKGNKIARDQHDENNHVNESVKERVIKISKLGDKKIVKAQTGAYVIPAHKAQETISLKPVKYSAEETPSVPDEKQVYQTDDAWTLSKPKYMYTYMGAAAPVVVTQDPETGIYSPSGYSYVGSPSDPRGFRNNNWLNIRISDNNWQGKVANNTDGTFEQFETPELGIRAAARNIRTYGKRGLQTVRSIISTWAPESDKNDTEAYIRNVASRMGVDQNQTLDLNDTDTMVKLISAMTISENGRPGDESIIRRGVEME